MCRNYSPKALDNVLDKIFSLQGPDGYPGIPGKIGIAVSAFVRYCSTLEFLILIRTPSGPAVLSFVERLSSFRSDFL